MNCTVLILCDAHFTSLKRKKMARAWDTDPITEDPLLVTHWPFSSPEVSLQRTSPHRCPWVAGDVKRFHPILRSSPSAASQAAAPAPDPQPGTLPSHLRTLLPLAALLKGVLPLPIRLAEAPGDAAFTQGPHAIWFASAPTEGPQELKGIWGF